MTEKLYKFKGWMILLIFLLAFVVCDANVDAKENIIEYDGGAKKIIYDVLGHYSLNYTGNTNHYDYWDASGTKKLVSRNYIDRADIAGINNSSASINPTDSKSSIKKAYLIWQSRSEEAPTESIGFVTPTGFKTEICAQKEWVCQDSRINAYGEKYTCVYTMCAEVTDIVCGDKGGYGTYTIANIPVWDGVQDGEVVCGGESVASWQLVIVEESTNFSLRTISLNIMSQYFFNINYTVGVNFAYTSSPTGDVSMQWYNLFTDVDSQYRLSGSISMDPAYWYEPSNYRFNNATRGLYKNGISFNERDTGDIYGTQSAASGAIHGHLFDDNRNWNNLHSTGIIYLQEGTNRGICMTTLGVAIDVMAYDIVFDGNGADKGEMDHFTCVYNMGYNLPANQYENSFWKFMGWNTKPDGSGISYKNKQFVRNLTKTENKVILYAQWRPDAYRITLDKQDGYDGTNVFYEWYGYGNYDTSECKSKIETIDIPKKDGCIFNGYYTERNGQGTKYIDSDGKILSTPTTFDEDTTLYAHWISEVYKITLDNQGADIAGTKEYYEKFGIGNYTTKACATKITKITMPKKEHHEFFGYYTERNGEGKEIIDKEGYILSESYMTFQKDSTIYAYWKPNTYTITLDSLDATVMGTCEFYEKYGVMNYTNLYVVDAESKEIVAEFAYTGGTQTFIAPYTGKYRFDLYGASGALSYAMAYVDTADSEIYYHGRGAWIYGEYELSKGECVYITVGGDGNSKTGGYNGGGNGGSFSAPALETKEGISTIFVNAGGGATHISLTNRGTLENYENYKEDIIAVAAGGAGRFSRTLTTKYNSLNGQITYRIMEDAVEEILDKRYIMEYKQGPYNTVFYNQGIKDSSRDYGMIVAGQERIEKDYKGVLISSMNRVYGTNDADAGRRNIYTTRYIDSISMGTFGKGVYGGSGGLYGGGTAVMGENRKFDSGNDTFILQVMEPWMGSSYSGKLSNAKGHVPYSYESLEIEKAENAGYYCDENGNAVKDTEGEIIPLQKKGRVKITYDGFKLDREEPVTSITIPQKEGYSFGGYYTEKNGAGTRCVDESGNILSSPTTFTSNTTLFAYWIADTTNTYKIAFNGNGADAGTMPLMICEFERVYMLTENTFTKPGYTFAGWSTKPDGSVMYADKESVKNLATHSGEVITLYAQWEAEKVSFMVRHYTESLSGDWELQGTDIKAGVTGNDIIPSAFVKSISGFTYKVAKVKDVVIDKATILGDGSLIVNLYYTRNSYSVVLQKDGGVSFVNGAGTYKYDERVNIDAVMLSNYEWENWSGTLHSMEKEHVFFMPANNVTMKANTQASIYTIYLDNQGANESGTLQYYEKYNTGNFIDRNCSTSITTIVLPQRKGYKFDGYYTKINGNGAQQIEANGKIKSTGATFTEDTVLYAEWIPITYKIHFEGNGTTGGFMEEMVCTYASQYQLCANQFTKSKYRFVGWNTKADGSGQSYVDESYVENLCDTQDDAITLYAQWTPNSYIIHFDANSGTGMMDDMECEFNVDYELNANQFSKAGNKFMGWSLIPDGKINFLDKAHVNNLHSTTGIVTLYAIWDECPWIVAKDLYYSLYEAQNGMITYDELMSHAKASDKEDGEELLPGVDMEKGTVFIIDDYQSTDFTQFTGSGSVTETYKVVDSVGNIFKKTITVYVVDTTAVEILPEGTTRFIDEKYYNETYENGGLEENSIWKTDSEYIAAIQKAFENKRNDTSILSFSLTYEEILKMKEFIRLNGMGNTQNEDALLRFYEEFLEENIVD